MSADEMTAMALSLIQALHNGDHLAYWRMLRAIKRQCQTDAIVGQLATVALTVVAETCDDDDVRVAAFLDQWLNDLHDSA
jgi:hypothetical protein